MNDTRATLHDISNFYISRVYALFVFIQCLRCATILTAFADSHRKSLDTI
eukprot:m.1638338 g.1638338  ORF g.1638338 m.1638338 type:complete len:50 (-) comp27607_c0_seq1:2679-2828(-)